MKHSANLAYNRRQGGLLGGLLVALILIGVIGALGYKFFVDDRGKVSQEDLITQTVSRGPFDHIVLTQGEIESSSNKEVICEVEARGSSGTPILWVIDEGTRVKEGDKLVELDSSAIEVELKEDRLQVITAGANVTTAEALHEQAKISRQEYLEGVYMTDEKAIQSEMAIAEQDLRKAKLALQSSERLLAKGLVKSLQLDADRFAVVNAQNQLEAAQGRLRVLQNLTRKKMLVQFDSEIEAAAAQLAAYQSELEEEKVELAETERQLKNCVLYAPSDGIVVHANRYSSRGGSAEFVVEAGASVRERQAIIRLPDPSLMQVKCKVNESRVTLIEEGMPVKIAVDAIPGMQLKGRVKKVNRYAEPSSFFSSSIKEYATIIEIIDPPESIRTGMTAEVQIFVEQLASTLQIPIQGLYEHGGKLYSLVQRGPETFETRAVEIGATNDSKASIRKGLKEGESLVLNLRAHLSLMDLPDVVAEDNSDMRAIGAEREARLDGPSPVTGGPDAAEQRGPTNRPDAGGRPRGNAEAGERPRGDRPRDGDRPGGRGGFEGGRPGGPDGARPDGARPGGGRPGGPDGARPGGPGGGRPGGPEGGRPGGPEGGS